MRACPALSAFFLATLFTLSAAAQPAVESSPSSGPVELGAVEAAPSVPALRHPRGVLELPVPAVPAVPVLPIGEPPSPDAESAKRLRVAGGVLMLGGVVLGALSGLFFYQADAAVRAAHARTSAELMECKAKGTSLCVAGLGESFAGIVETLGAYTSLGIGVAHVVAGFTLVVVGERRATRRLELRPGLAPLRLPASASQGSGVAPSGLRLVLAF